MTQTRKLILLLLCLSIGQVLIAQTTYTTIVSGNWSAPSTWSGGVVPPEPIPAGDIVNVSFFVRTPSTPQITNNGTINIVDGAGSFGVISLSGASTLTNNGSLNATSDGFSVIYIEGTSQVINTGTFKVEPLGGSTPALRLEGGDLTNKTGGVMEIGDILFTIEDENSLLTNEMGATLTLAPSSSFSINDNDFVSDNVVFRNAGTFTTSGGQFWDTGTQENLPTGVMNINSASFARFDLQNKLNNTGTININYTTQSFTLTSEAVLNSTSGTINLNSGFFRGNGTVLLPTLSNDGNLIPTDADFPASGDRTFNLTGNYGGTGIITSLPVAGLLGPTLAVSGNADLSQQTLRMFTSSSTSGLSDPPIGTSFTIISAASVIGTFASESLPFIADPTKEWQVEYGADFVNVVVVAVNTCTDTDTEAPVANCPSIPDVVLDGNGNGMLAANIGTGLSTDNCDPPTETSPAVSVNCAMVGTPQTVVLTATDAKGLMGTANCSFNVVDPNGDCCTLPVINNVTASTPACPGDQVIIVVDGSLNDATQWVLYTGDCGDTQIATSTNGIFSVQAGATTTYYVSGEGGCAGSAKLIWEEQFDGGIPNTWTLNSSPAAASWQWSDDGEADQAIVNGVPVNAVWYNSNLEGIESPTSANGAAMFNSDVFTQAAGISGPLNSSMTSPTIDCSGLSNVSLKFNQMLRYCCSSDTPTILEVSNDNGATWTNFPVNTSLQANLGTPSDDVIDLDISSIAANQANVKVRFRWAGASDIAYYWLIDDVQLIQRVACESVVVEEVEECDSCEPTPISCPSNISVGNDSGDCGAIVSFTLPDGATATPPSGSFFPVGTTTVEVEGSDGCDGTSTCSFTVTVNDTEAPTIKFCPNPIVNLDNTNDRCGAIIVFSPTPEDNCPGASIEQTEGLASGSLFPIGSTTVVFVATDAADLTAECSFTVNVVDNQKPEITCPSNTTVGTDDGECGADVHLPAPNADDNCGVTELKGRYRLVDENDNPLGSYTSRMNDPSDYLAVGRYQINWRAKDAANNKRSCSYYVTVEDDEDPTAVCKDVTIEFNGEASIDLAVSQVWNEAASNDNCGTVYYVSTSPSLSISCDDLGSVVPLTVTIRDEAGNTDNCTADVTVTGLPCGWSEGPDDGSLNCPGDTDVDYDVDDESFSMSSDGCWQGSHDPDKAAYVYQELCGDGTLTARLASINTAGYAGLMLRETLDPESRRAGALKDFSTRRVRREYRSSYGGSVTRIHSNRSRVKWFRIVRKGDEIKSYTSTNGSYWRLLYRVIMPNLEDCVHIGMMAYSKNSSSEVQAVFDNVSFSGSGSSLIDNNNSLPNTFTAFDTDLEIEQPAVNIFPNPSNGQSQIELNGFQETPAQIMVRDAFGKVVRQIEVDYPEGTVLPLDLQDMPAGLYLISVMQEQQQVITKKLMIQK